MATEDGRAKRLYSRVLGNAFVNDALIGTFQCIASEGIDKLVPTLAADNSFMASTLYAKWLQDILPDKKIARDTGVQQTLAAKVTEKQVSDAKSAINAATIVFAHSVLDAAVDDLLEVTLLLDAKSWVERAKAQKVTLEDVTKSAKEDIEGKCIRKNLSQLKKESVLKKLDVLHALCKPDRTFDPVGKYKYSRDTIRKLDRARQDIVHRVRIKQTTGNVSTLLEYSTKTVLYLVALLNHRYGIQGDLAFLMECFSGKGSA